MKFTADVFRLVILLLEVQAASGLDVTKPQEVAHSSTPGKMAAVPQVIHMSAQSTIPTKVVHAHAVSGKPKAPMAALTGIKKSGGSNEVSPKRAKEMGKALNKSNHWGLFDTKANATAANHSKGVHAQISKANVASTTKKATIATQNHTQEAMHVQGKTSKAATTSVPKALPATEKEHSKESKETRASKPPVPAAVNKSVTQVTAVKAAPKAVPKEAKSTNVTAAQKTSSHATAIVKAAPNMPHVLVNAKAKKSLSKSESKNSAALGAQNKAEYQLLNFLASDMEKKELPPFEVYLPACLEHVHNLIDNLDMAYTDVQLHAVLVDECWLKKSFPKSHDSSFSTDAACKQFATNTMNARYLELQTGSQEGYEGLCADYYVHIGGDLGKKKKAAPPPPPPKKKATEFPWHFVVVAAVILSLFCVILCMVIYKRHTSA